MNPEPLLLRVLGICSLAIWPEWEFACYESQRIEWPEYWTNRRKRK